MNIWYEPIFDVLFEHTFYADGFSPDFRAVPTVETQRMMRNLGLVMKPLPTGLRVFCKLDTHASVGTTFYAATLLDAPFSLLFRLEMTNNWFGNFTDLPAARSPQQFFYCSNRVQVSGATPSNLLLGEAESTGGKVGAADLLTVVGSSAAWSFVVPSGQTTTQISWTDAAGNTLLQQDFAKNEEHRVQANFPKLHTLPDGRYRVLTTPGTPSGNRIFLKNSALAEQPPFGVLEIFSHPTHNDYRFRTEENVNVNGQIESLSRLSPKTYRVRFERRALPWQFFVVRRSSGPPDAANLQVSYGSNQVPYPNAVTFAEQAVVGEPNKRLFRSNVPLPFFQTPKKGIELRNKPASPAIESLPNLPNPPVTAVRRDGAGNLYAESVIYI